VWPLLAAQKIFASPIGYGSNHVQHALWLPKRPSPSLTFLLIFLSPSQSIVGQEFAKTGGNKIACNSFLLDLRRIERSSPNSLHLFGYRCNLTTTSIGQPYGDFLSGQTVLILSTSFKLSIPGIDSRPSVASTQCEP
jgi:hypothetical protein